MKTENQTRLLSPTDERIRIIRLEEELPFKLTNEYYADKLNRTHGAISQALNGYPNTSTLFARIHRHNDWLEKKIKERKELKQQKILVEKRELRKTNLTQGLV